MKSSELSGSGGSGSKINLTDFVYIGVICIPEF